jgi:hypothetical protein
MNLVTKYFPGGLVGVQLEHLNVFLPLDPCALGTRTENFQPGSVKLGEQAGAMAVRSGLNPAAPPL